MSGQDTLRLDIKVNMKQNPALNYASGFRDRKKIKIQDLKNAISKFKDLKGLVIGDLIIDEYLACSPVGMSQEDKTIVYEKGEVTDFIGGAGIVAGHCASLGAHVKFFSVVGEDEVGTNIDKRLRMLGVDPKLLIDKSRKTSKKNTFRI